MVFELTSGDLQVKINSKGAEISSVIHKEREYIWQAKPNVWQRHAPILFPIVGKLKNNKFIYNDNEYTLEQHGFARDKEFKCCEQTNRKVTFELESDDDTRKKYPFDFNLKVTYEVNELTLNCSYEVTNLTQGKMYFSIGAHPGFRTDDLSECKLRFEKQLYETTLLNDGLLSDKRSRLPLPSYELPLHIDLFEKDALVFENNQINGIELISKSGRGVELKCEGWPYFGIWSKKGCNEFVCLEPWYGITDSIDSTSNITQKKGIIILKDAEKFKCSFSIRFL